MHLALWMHLDIFSTCLILAQNQNDPSHIHFAAVKQMVGYLQLRPNIPLTFDRSCFNNTVGLFDLEIDQFDPLMIQVPGPESFHVASVQLLRADHAAYDLSIADIHVYTPQDPIKFIPPYKLDKARDLASTHPATPAPIDSGAFVPLALQLIPHLVRTLKCLHRKLCGCQSARWYL
jgi:hypothetical protein